MICKLGKTSQGCSKSVQLGPGHYFVCRRGGDKTMDSESSCDINRPCLTRYPHNPYSIIPSNQQSRHVLVNQLHNIHCKRIVSKTQVSVSYAVSNFFSLTELLTESESCLSWKEWGVFSQFLLTVSKI